MIGKTKHDAQLSMEINKRQLESIVGKMGRDEGPIADMSSQVCDLIPSRRFAISRPLRVEETVRDTLGLGHKLDACSADFCQTVSCESESRGLHTQEAP